MQQEVGGMVVHAQQLIRGGLTIWLHLRVFGSLGNPQNMQGGMGECLLPTVSQSVGLEGT